jgi:hypothetical protein
MKYFRTLMLRNQNLDYNKINLVNWKSYRIFVKQLREATI